MSDIDVGQGLTGVVFGFILCYVIIVGVLIRGCGIVLTDVKIIQRERAIEQGIAHFHPTIRDSIIYDDQRVRFVLEGKE